MIRSISIKLSLMAALVILLAACIPVDPASGTLTPPYPNPVQGGEGEPSAYPPPTAGPVLKPADSQELVSGICGEASDDVVEIMLTSDGPASPRCVKIRPEQRLKFINARDVPVQLAFGPFSETIPPGGEALLDRKAGEYLAPGVHSVEGAEILLLISDAYPAPSGRHPVEDQSAGTVRAFLLLVPAGWSVDATIRRISDSTLGDSEIG